MTKTSDENLLPGQAEMTKTSDESLLPGQTETTNKIDQSFVPEQDEMTSNNDRRSVPRQVEMTTKSYQSLVLGQNKMTTKNDQSLVLVQNEMTTESDQSLVLGQNEMTTESDQSLVPGQSEITTKSDQSLVPGQNEMTTKSDQSLVPGQNEMTTKSDQSLVSEQNEMTTKSAQSLVSEQNEMTTKSDQSLVSEQNEMTTESDQSLVPGQNEMTTKSDQSLVPGQNEMTSKSSQRALSVQDDTVAKTDQIVQPKNNTGRKSRHTRNISDHLPDRLQRSLGSSFGGVVFKQNSLPSQQKTVLSHKCSCRDNEAHQSQDHFDIHEIACVGRTDGYTNPASCRHTHNAVLKTCIDPNCTCKSNKYEQTKSTLSSVCCDNKGIDIINKSLSCDQDTGLSFSGPVCELLNFKKNACSFGVLKNVTEICSEHGHVHLRKSKMGDDELFVEKAGGKEVSNRRINSGRKSLDNNATNTSDNGFGGRISALNSSSLSDITSVSSTSSNVGPLGTITSRMRFQLRHGQHGHESEAADYMTPLQRMEKEVKLLRKERSQLLSEKEEKDTELESMKNSIETMKLRMQREKENELADYVDKLRVSEREKFEQIEELFKVQEELTQMDVKYATIKREMSDKEEKYEEYLLDMYKKGQMAALFEREDELEMLATTPKSNVSVRELTRKLSKTELELAKWQGLKLGESYAHMELPDTQADATLSFLKDAFYHFLTERSGNEDHLRAIIKIFKYSETQMSKIRKGLEEFKHLDKKRITRI